MARPGLLWTLNWSNYRNIANLKSQNEFNFAVKFLCVILSSCFFFSFIVMLLFTYLSNKLCSVLFTSTDSGCLCVYRVVLGFAAMIPVIVYPLMKRITYWPQAFLGKYSASVLLYMIFRSPCFSVMMCIKYVQKVFITSFANLTLLVGFPCVRLH